MTTSPRVSEAWDNWRARVDLNEYHARWQQMEVRGESSHGEADFIESLVHGRRTANVLDAGCGMGRIAIELHRRGIEVEGTDLDDDLLAFARADAPTIRWHLADLATASFDSTYELIAMPGNVMIFCRIDDRAKIVTNLARHLGDNGLLVAGFSLQSSPDALTLSEYDAACAGAGLALDDRFATWDRDQYEGGDYAVSVHRRKWLT